VGAEHLCPPVCVPSQALAKYMHNPANFFVVSSDFCHWGQRFSFTWWVPAPSDPCIYLPFYACEGEKGALRQLVASQKVRLARKHAR
jgi:predicted class III extradiol MEMO1 family dioxygenase